MATWYALPLLYSHWSLGEWQRGMLSLYSIFVDHLENGNVVWGPYNKADMKVIEGVQRRATKLIPALKNNTYKERLSHLKLPSLAHRRRRGDMIYTYKIITGKFNINKEAFFERSHHRTRGHKYNI